MRNSGCVFEVKFEVALIKYLIRQSLVSQMVLLTKGGVDVTHWEHYMNTIRPILNSASKGDSQHARQIGKTLFESICTIKGDRGNALAIFERIVQMPLKDLKALLNSYTIFETTVREIDN